MEYLLIVSIAALLASFVFTVVFVVRGSGGANVWGRTLLVAGAAMLLMFFFLRFFQLGYFPLRTLKDSFVFLALLLTVAHLVTVALARIDILNLLVAPLASSLVLAAFLFARNEKSADALIYLRNYLAVVHIPVFVLGYTCFVIAGAFSVFYLMLDREMKRKAFSYLFAHFPPLLRIDRYINFFIWLGFALLTLGILTGALFAWQINYAFMYADPKVVSVFVVWLYYSVYIHGRARSGWVGKRVCYLALLGCALILIAYLSTNVLLTSKIHGFR